jgi:Large polyvalent protein associated domain 38
MVPAIEVLTNWDFFRQRPIENLGVSRLPPEQRTGPNVSFIAEALAKIIPGNVSPLQLEHLINGYFGIGGKVITSGVDAVAGNMGFLPERPSGVFGSGIPAKFASVLGLDALIRDADVPLWDRWVEDFYQTKRLADEQYSGARAYALQGQIEDARDLIKNDPSLYRMRPIFNQAESQLSKISQAMRQIRASNLSAEDKRRRLDPLVRARNQTAETIMRTYNRLQATGGRRAA